MTVGDQVKSARRARGWSQKRLGEEAGRLLDPPRPLSQVAIKKIESGQTERSKYLPEVLEALDLSTNRHNIENTTKLRQIIPLDQLAGERNFPVYASAEGGNGTLIVSTDPVDFVRRPTPLSKVKDAYGLIVVGESMIPELKPGDTALVHPHLPPSPGEPCVFYADNGHGEVRAVIKSFIRSTVRHWLVEQWNPSKKLTLSRKEWQSAHRIVGKYSRR